MDFAQYVFVMDFDIQRLDLHRLPNSLSYFQSYEILNPGASQDTLSVSFFVVDEVEETSRDGTRDDVFRGVESRDRKTCMLIFDVVRVLGG